jgi:hypothetical protein
MTRLVDRFPTIQRLTTPLGLTDAESLYKLVAPYLDWQLAEIDILLWEPPREGLDPKQRRFIIVTGQVVSVWLRHQRNLTAGGKV